MNPGGIRQSLDAGEVLWGELFSIQPFSNDLVSMDLTGAQIDLLLEQQWINQTPAQILKTSGLTYTWDAARPIGDRVIEIRDGSGNVLGATTTLSRDREQLHGLRRRQLRGAAFRHEPRRRSRRPRCAGRIRGIAATAVHRRRSKAASRG